MGDLERLEVLLMRALRLKGHRRDRHPSAQSRPDLFEAARGLKAYVAASPSEAAGWRLLARAEAALLNFSGARKALQECHRRSAPPDRNDLEDLAKVVESEIGALFPQPKLRDLGRHLLRTLQEPCDHTFRHVDDWLRAKFVDPGSVQDALTARWPSACDHALLEKLRVSLSWDPLFREGYRALE